MKKRKYGVKSSFSHGKKKGRHNGAVTKKSLVIGHQSSIKKQRTIDGTIRITRGGIGYVSSPALTDELEIAHENLGTALHGDRVRVRISPKPPRVTEILGRAKDCFVGTLRVSQGNFFVEPDDRRVYVGFEIPTKKTRGAKSGYKVLVRLTDWKKRYKNPLGEVVEVLGKAGKHEVEMQAIVRDRGFDFGFPQEVEKEATELKKRYNTIPQKEFARRRDLRTIPTFTIDPEDAKDFDDALSLVKLPNGNFKIGIHIADVTFFVRPGSAINTEAVKRGTSIYLVDRTIPMLPEVLSNDLCSLTPHEDKLTFSAIFELSPKGEVGKRWFGKTVINSHKRFTYREAQDVLDAGKGQFFKELTTLLNLSQKIRKEREKGGAIAFEQDEVKFELDQAGKPIRVFVKERLATNKLIEDFMILANSEVAEFATTHDKNAEHTFVYRVHDLPDEDRIKELVRLIRTLGYDIPKGKLPKTARGIAELLEKVEGSAHEEMIHLAAIQSMAKAVYATKNIGHFGLSLKHYTHFTSPIRRYPDMMVHRILFTLLSGKTVSKEAWEEYEALTRMSSQLETAAQDAEWASIKWKLAEYMAERIGKTYDGTITGFIEKGMFVREEETHAEGMVRFKDIQDDHYIYDERNVRAVGQKTGRRFTLGDTVRIKVARVNVEKRLIDYTLA